MNQKDVARDDSEREIALRSNSGAANEPPHVMFDDICL
jgi:hypothetical protein